MKIFPTSLRGFEVCLIKSDRIKTADAVSRALTYRVGRFILEQHALWNNNTIDIDI